MDYILLFNSYNLHEVPSLDLSIIGVITQHVIRFELCILRLSAIVIINDNNDKYTFAKLRYLTQVY